MSGKFSAPEDITAATKIVKETFRDPDQARGLNLLTDQQQPMEVQPGFFEIIAMSIGVAFYDRKEDNEMSIRKDADQAMYAVKRNGKNGFTIYNSMGKHEIFIDSKLVT